MSEVAGRVFSRFSCLLLSVVLRRSKLPVSLLSPSTPGHTEDLEGREGGLGTASFAGGGGGQKLRGSALLSLQSFSDAFGDKRTRKRPALHASDLRDLLQQVSNRLFFRPIYFSLSPFLSLSLCLSMSPYLSGSTVFLCLSMPLSVFIYAALGVHRPSPSLKKSSTPCSSRDSSLSFRCPVFLSLPLPYFAHIHPRRRTYMRTLQASFTYIAMYRIPVDNTCIHAGLGCIYS